MKYKNYVKRLPIELQDKILTERIEGQKKYQIKSTPTILINEKKYISHRWRR